MASVFTKGIINNVYSKLNDSSDSKCKTRYPDDQLKYKMCSHQGMADNARILISRLRAQIGGCTKTKDPKDCSETIKKLIMYLEKKQEDHENKVDQLKDLEG